MISYLRQVAICESIRKTIEEALTQGNDMGLRAKVNNIPTTESILRAVSLFPNIRAEDELRDLITKNILSSLRLTEIQKEHLGLNG